MGMGLSIARSMIAAHGGRIWAENAAAGGAVFRFTLREYFTDKSH
jgi:two-component system sensor kinase FixL